MTWEYDDEEEKWNGKGGYHGIVIVKLEINPFGWESKELNFRTSKRFEGKITWQRSIKGNWARRKS